MKKRAIATAILTFWLAAGYVFGSEPITFESDATQTTLLELFTSEGCSSCPAAEKWLSQFKTNSDLWKRIVPVAFHVDYWDNLGWPDRFAKAEFTDRQRRYAAGWRGDSVYTPGFAVDGKEWRGWFSGAAPPTRSVKVGPLRVTLTNEAQAAGTFVSEAPALHPLKLEVALLGTNLESDVKRGENRGRKLRHDFVVLQLGEADMIGDGNRWNASLSFLSKPAGDKPTAIAAWVIPPGESGPIQATGGWLKP